MSDGTEKPRIDMIRWTFTVNPSRRNEVETYLSDQGLDVTVRGDDQFTVLWDEPDQESEQIIEEVWEINGGAFEVTHEEFQRLDLSIFHAEEEPGDTEKAA